MKRWVGLVLITAVLWAGCDDDGDSSDSSGAFPNLQGVWDFSLTSEPLPAKEYTVTVESGGSVGVAVVSVTGPMSSNTPTLVTGNTVALGCGISINFADPIIPANFSLATGDNWLVAVSNGSPRAPVPGNTVDSNLGPVTSGGSDSCVAKLCDGSALASLVPGSAKTITGSPVGGGQWHSVRITQNGPNVTASVAEQRVLSLYLSTVILPGFTIIPPLISAGDMVTLSYRRTIQADGVGGDLWRVVIRDGVNIIEVEHLWGDALSVTGTKLVSHTFIPSSFEILVDFMAGLSGQGENVVLDEVEAMTPAGMFFSEDFESAPTANCWPVLANADRWELREPVWSIGSLCVSVNGALEGAYSARWAGGSTRDITGSIITGSAISGITSLLGIGEDGADLSALNGLFLEAVESTWTYHLTSFSATEQGVGTLVGTFRGESRAHDCIEVGQMTASIQQAQATNVSASYWVMNVAGDAISCVPALASGNTLQFGDTLTTASGDTIRILQFGTAFVGAEKSIDDYGNSYDLRGAVGGNAVALTLTDTNNRAEAQGLGVLVGSRISGTLTGSLVFDSGRVCEIVTGSTFTVDLK